MGITGLLPFLEKATRPCHISEFRGGTVVIDSYCWLHKGANACAEQLARGEDSQVYVYYCLKYVKMLLSYDIHPIMVFDGKNLPAKAETEAKRRESRKNARQRAAELLRIGKIEEARTYLKQCVDITPQMANNLIKECRKLKVDCIVAPYESDAQLAYFNLKGIAEVVITEDSDLVLFGCKNVMYKLDMNGAGQLVESEKIYLAMKVRPDQYSFDKFRYMCILSGCDYIESLRGIGLKKALKFILLTAETNPEIFLQKLPSYLGMKTLNVTSDYKENFMIADATFKHQTVFDPFKKKLVHLTDPEITGTKTDYCKNSGEIFDHDLAYQVAIGNLNPYSFEKIDDWRPIAEHLSPNSIWLCPFRKKISRKQEKEIGKAQMQNFLKSSSVSSSSSVLQNKNSVEQKKDMEDKQLEKELAFYSKLKIETDVEAVVEETITDVKKEQTSPVISKNKNPFLIRKRLSKFPETNSENSNIIVKSRFFTKTEAVSVSQECVKSESDVIDTVKNTQSIQEEVTNKIEIVSKKRINEDMDNKEGKQEDCEISETRSNDIPTETSKFPRTGSNSSIKNSQKRIKLGPCKSVGLKKKIQGQQSIQQFFSTFKKQ